MTGPCLPKMDSESSISRLVTPSTGALSQPLDQKLDRNNTINVPSRFLKIGSRKQIN